MNRFFADDRGNVVDFYDRGDRVARLDREAGPEPHATSWDGDEDRANGYADEIDNAREVARE